MGGHRTLTFDDHSRSRELRYRRFADPIWCAIAAFMGFLCLQLPNAIRMPDQSLQQVLGHGAFFIAGLLLGFARPQKVWRWGLASVLLIPLIDLSLMVNPSVYPPMSVLDCMPILLQQAPQYLVRALPAILGAYVGEFCARGC